MLEQVLAASTGSEWYVPSDDGGAASGDPGMEGQGSMDMGLSGGWNGGNGNPNGANALSGLELEEHVQPSLLGDGFEGKQRRRHGRSECRERGERSERV